MQNTNVRTKLQDPEALARAPSTEIYKLHEAWAVKNGYRKKVTSNKQEAASAKQQAKKYFRKTPEPQSMNQQA